MPAANVLPMPGEARKQLAVAGIAGSWLSEDDDVLSPKLPLVLPKRLTHHTFQAIAARGKTAVFP